MYNDLHGLGHNPSLPELAHRPVAVRGADRELAMTSTPTFWDRWLLAVGWLVIVFGLLLAVFNRSASMDVLFHNQIDPAFWPDAPSPETLSFRTWAYAVLGATMAGWGVLVVALATNPFARRERWARNALAASLGLWFALDTSLSLAAGVIFNAAFNTLFLLIVAAPMVATWRDFRRSE